MYKISYKEHVLKISLKGAEIQSYKINDIEVMNHSKKY